MPFTDFFLQSLIDHGIRGVTYTPPTTAYLGFSSSAVTQAKGSPPYWNFTEPATQAYLVTALVSGTAPTALAVQPLSVAVASGDTVVVTDPTGAHTQSFTASGAAAVGATSIPIAGAAVANYAYPVGSLVQDITPANYVRLGIAANTTNWVQASPQPAVGYEIYNGPALTLVTAGGPWSTGAALPDWGLWDAPGGGNLLWYGTALDQSGNPLRVPNAGITPVINANSLSVLGT